MIIKKKLFKKEYWVTLKNNQKLGPFQSITSASERFEKLAETVRFTKDGYNNYKIISSAYDTNVHNVYYNDNELYIKQNNHEGVLSEKGIVLPCQHDKIIAHCGAEKFLVQSNQNKKIGLVDKEGNVLVDCKYDLIGSVIFMPKSPFSYNNNEKFFSTINDIVPVCLNDKWGAYNISLKKEILPCQHSIIEIIDGGNYIKTDVVGSKNLVSYYDVNGEPIAEKMPMDFNPQEASSPSSKHLTDFLICNKNLDVETLDKIKNLLSYICIQRISKAEEPEDIDYYLKGYNNSIKSVDEKIEKLSFPQEKLDQIRREAIDKIKTQKTSVQSSTKLESTIDESENS